MDIEIYRKPTHTDRYLQFSSHNPDQVKRGVVSCLFHRARTVARGENVAKEEQHLTDVLRENGYPNSFITSASRPRPPRDQDESQAVIYLPYVAGLSEDIRRVCREFNIRTVFRSAPTLRRQLTKVKDTDPAEKRSYVIYEIPCSCGCTYIGETKRALETRLREHQAATRCGELEKLAIAEHAWKNDHQVLWSQTRVLDEARNTTSLLVKEALYIRRADSSRLVNRDEGLAISRSWSAIIKPRPSMTSPASAELSELQSDATADSAPSGL